MNKTSSRKEKGQSLVELGMGFTFLLLLIGAVVDLGGIFYTFVSLRDTAQEGAIYGAYQPTDLTGITSRIQSSASFPIDASQITAISVTCNGVDCVTTNTNSCQGQKISVAVSYNYNLTMPLIGAVIGRQTVPLNSTVTATILQSKATIRYLQTQGITCP